VIVGKRDERDCPIIRGGGGGKGESDPVRVHNDRFALMRERGRVDLSIRSSVQHVRRDTERKIVLES